MTHDGDNGDNMEVVEVALGERSYPIYIGEGLLDRRDLLARRVRGPRALIVTNDVVGPLYAARLQAALGDRLLVDTFVLPDGEEHKNLTRYAELMDFLLEHRHDRTTTLIALGGGVVGDLTGFAAATYQRGVDFVQVPTTLLAQVDSSVGGKTAVNHPRGKNMIGAFYQPRCVVADSALLATLPDREYRAGLAEVVKYGVIQDAALFGWLEVHAEALARRDAGALRWAVRRSCEIKAEVVSADEQEAGLRAILNYGHTFAHAIETLSGYGALLHGEAVAMGMVMAADLAVQVGRLAAADAARQAALLRALGLPVCPPRLPVPAMLEIMAHDKKVQGGRLRLVLAEAIGRVAVTDAVPPEAVRRSLERAMGIADG